ncbi:MAG: hypothetical protein WCK89_19710 [bacterium]
MRTLLTVPIDYDPDVTDPESLASAMDRLLETALSTPGILDEYGHPRIGEFLPVKPIAELVGNAVEAALETAGMEAALHLNRSTLTHRRYVLYDFDRQELATTHVYDNYTEAVDDAGQLQDVLVLPLEFEEHRVGRSEPAVTGADPAATEQLPCDCQLPGYFCSGVPGILAYLEDGRLPDGAGVERCDLCGRYPCDEAARKKLVALGIAHESTPGGHD